MLRTACAACSKQVISTQLKPVQQMNVFSFASEPILLSQVHAAARLCATWHAHAARSAALRYSSRLRWPVVLSVVLSPLHCHVARSHRAAAAAVPQVLRGVVCRLQEQSAPRQVPAVAWGYSQLSGATVDDIQCVLCTETHA